MKDRGGVKKQPMRRCAGCGEHFPKKELVRVLRRPDGSIVLDLTGKISGRGAYICKNGCISKCQKTQALDRTFKMAIDKELYQKIEKEFAELVR